MGNNLIDAKQLAEFLNVPVTWVWAATRNERIPYIKVGKYLRFDCKAVLASLPRRGNKAEEENNIIQFPERDNKGLSQEKDSSVYEVNFNEGSD